MGKRKVVVNGKWEKIKDIILQSTALAFINVLALVYDQEFLNLAFVVDGIILGINIKALYSK